MLHYLDDLDSKMESMRAQFERESEVETAWTSYNPSLARPLLNTQKFLEKGLATPAQPAVAESASEELFAETGKAPEIAEAANKANESGSLDALQQKFAKNKPTPVGAKTE
jgi:hypothetical protein